MRPNALHLTIGGGGGEEGGGRGRGGGGGGGGGDNDSGDRGGGGSSILIFKVRRKKFFNFLDRITERSGTGRKEPQQDGCTLYGYMNHYMGPCLWGPVFDRHPRSNNYQN